MKKSVLFLVIFMAFFNLKLEASHIVGGEFEFIFSGRGYIYNVNMNMYYDELNAEIGLLDEDLDILISVFDKKNNISVRVIKLTRISKDFINYSNNGCNDPRILLTRKLFYTGTVDMTGLNAPEGYYMVWERCCRNENTLNIVHYDGAGYDIAGQVFYLELPPVSVLGKRFINSSPIFGTVESQYFCRDVFSYINFKGIDLDGDSLVYRMVNPLKGHSTAYDPQPTFPQSAPYDSIDFLPGYFPTNAIRGNPRLRINKNTGVLSVNPSELGLFAFAVACEEYRDGVKIGEVRRDFQFYVQDCPKTYPPSVGLNNGSLGTGGSNKVDTIVVKLNKDTCYSIYVSDSSASFFNLPDAITIFYGETNLPKSVLAFSPDNVTLIPSADTTTLKMCFSTCDKVLIERDSIYFLDIVVKDGDASTCPRRTDTLRTYVYVDVDETNSKPIIGTTLLPETTLNAYPDSLISFYVYGLDEEAFDLKVILADGYRFNLNDYRMLFTKVYEGTDSIAYLFNWKPTCLDLQTRIEYNIDFKLKDRSCISSHSVSTRVTLKLQDVDTGLQNLSPANLITPNADNLNDCFTLPNLPADNCTYIFQDVEIYNRWGARVFMSSNRDFSWCPADFSDGVYYYYINLTGKQLKGWLQVLR